MPIYKKCITCNNEFKVPPCRHKALYCSQKCMPTGGKDNPNWKGGLIKTLCKQCNVELNLKKKNILESGNFCSRSCSAIFNGKVMTIKANENRIKKYCKVCSTLILIKKSHEHTEGTCCSRKCYAIYMTTSLLGKENPNYKHGNAHISNWYFGKRKEAAGSYPKDYYKTLLTLQNNQCIVCKNKLIKYHLDHIMPIALGGTNDYKNIQLLCPTCNHQKHAKHPIDFMQQKGYLL